MKVIHDLSKEGSMSLRLQTFQGECFDRLNVHLRTALAKLSNITGQNFTDGVDLTDLSIRPTIPQKLKFSALEKQLKQLVDDLESWHKTFDPSWFLIARVQHDDVDTLVGTDDDDDHSGKDATIAVIQQIRQLARKRPMSARNQQSIFADPSSLSDTHSEVLPTHLKIASWRTTGERVLLETTTYPDGTDHRQATIFVRHLAKFLSTPEISSLNLLKCLGVLQLDQPSSRTKQFQYIFALPVSKSSPASLRATLASSPPSLDTKLNLAKCLARALTSLHAANFVHKNIRPETILVFEDAHNENSIPYLVGFESLRPSEAHSSLVSDMAWERNVYRHPSRQGLRPQEYYNMQHDIYSFGVCLLEIGLWTSFIDYDTTIKPSKSLPIENLLQKSNQRQMANEIKELLISTAERDLPSKMGRTFTEVVLSSLTCLDKDANNELANSPDMYDEDGIAIGVAFIENILMRLESVSI